MSRRRSSLGGYVDLYEGDAGRFITSAAMVSRASRRKRLQLLSQPCFQMSERSGDPNSGIGWRNAENSADLSVAEFAKIAQLDDLAVLAIERLQSTLHKIQDLL